MFALSELPDCRLPSCIRQIIIPCLNNFKKADCTRQRTLLYQRLRLPFFMATDDIEGLVLRWSLTTLALSIGMFGMNISLSASCVYPLTTSQGRTQYRPAKVITSHIYILYMLGLATYAAVHSFQYSYTELKLMGGYRQVDVISLPFMILGADAFMVCINYGLITNGLDLKILDMEMLCTFSRH